jgi:hypothetical protein
VVSSGIVVIHFGLDVIVFSLRGRGKMKEQERISEEVFVDDIRDYW